MFGTLYVPVEREDLEFGLADDGREFPTVSSFYMNPFRSNAKTLAGRLLVLLLLVFFVYFAVAKFAERIAG